MSLLLLAVSAALLSADTPAAADDCARPDGAVMGVWWPTTRNVRPGETIKLYPEWASTPGSSFGEVPQACIKDLTSSAPSLVRIAKDGLSVTVDPKAPPGTEALLKGTIGTSVISGLVHVTGPADGK